MTETIVTVDGVDLCVEAFGRAGDPAVLLIAGGSQSMDWWDVGFCERLAGAGRLVVRYDHRDTGRSTSSPAGKPSYSGADLGTDPLRVLDGLGIDRAHVVGLSMGGGIAQRLAALHADRVLTATLIATGAAGDRASDDSLPGMEPRVAATFDDPAPEPEWHDRRAVVDHLVEAERPFAGALGFDEARVRRLAEIAVDRTRDVAAAVTNHWLVVDEPAGPFRLADISVPTLVMHGTDDPLFPYAHGEALAAEISDARLVPLPGMGHEMPPPDLWDLVVPAIIGHTAPGRGD
jgi:pimeloyl-ACP methyl ester carboxylesterase